ncbi:MAG: hypothetical protein MN733_10315, partial [Nitrososphaera sp.]|nr:hypothetical protein [Nitrososphaera sp.]
MAQPTGMIVIKADELPALRRGFPAASGPAVAIRESGHITFSALLTKLLGIQADAKAAVTWEGEKTRKMHIYIVSKPPKGLTEANLLRVAYSEKNKSASILGSGFLNQILD